MNKKTLSLIPVLVILLLNSSFPLSAETATSTSSIASSSSTTGKITAPSKDEIETRIKDFASKQGLTTFTDSHGRMAVKDSSGNPVPLPPEIFAPAGELPSKDVIESRIKKWAEKMGFTTATDPHGRLGAKNQNGQFVALPPSIFFPESASNGQDPNQSVESATSASSSATTASASAITATSSNEVTDPASTLNSN
ncbi:MAG: hypothetical protein HQM08_14495 [Candidatus Riflebacteria bacterium]|nr:hypothetical protein [Candidatus Riflebacteria bacterium]